MVARKIADMISVETDLNGICNRYNSDKRLIWEYNGGGSDKWKTQMTQQEKDLALNLFRDFIDKYC